jgi:hypothetical protein
MPRPGFLHLRSAIGGPRTPLGSGELIRQDLASSADWPGVDAGIPMGVCSARLTRRTSLLLIIGASLDLWGLTVWGMLQVF